MEEEFDALSGPEETVNEIEKKVGNEAVPCKIQPILTVGDKFSSYSEFEVKLREYEQNVLNNYWIRDSRTLENLARKYPTNISGKANKDLKYYSVRISCIKGGRKHKKRGEKRQTLTFRQGCPSTMFLKITTCGKYLQLVELNEEHNHVVSEPLFKTVCHQRLNNLPADVLNKAKDEIQVRGNMKLIQNNIIAETGHLVSLKDLHNLNKSNGEKKDFKACVDILKNVYNCNVKIKCGGEDKHLIGLFFQDNVMEDTFAGFPEMIFVDGTYSLLDNKASVYLIMVEDSHGSGAVVAAGVLFEEDEDTIDWFIQCFKESNPKYEKIEVIMSDKDAKERAVFRKNFPWAKLQICLFHVLQIFNREITPKKMGISSEECEIAKKHLQKLAYASSYENYVMELAEMKSVVPKSVLDYFNKNWANLTDEWVLYQTFSRRSFLNKTNNCLENFNQKLKAVIKKYSSFEDFIKNFFICVNSARVNQNINVSKELNKISTNNFPENSPEYFYQNFLTPHAFQKVFDQLQRKNFVEEILFLEETKGLVTTSEGLLEVSDTTCECLFNKSMGLPCRHLFKLRSLKKLPLFDEKICLERWTKTYFVKSNPFFNMDDELLQFRNNDVTITQSEVPVKSRCLSKHEKFKMMNSECLKLSNISAEVSSRIFYERLNFLKKIREKWANYQEIGIEDFEEEIIGEELSENGESKSEEEDFSEMENNNSTLNIQNSQTQNKVDHPYYKKFNFVSEVGKENDENENEENILSSIKIPEITKVRGRPKGMGSTAIGFTRKRKKGKLSKLDQKKLGDDLKKFKEKKRRMIVLNDLTNNLDS